MFKNKISSYKNEIFNWTKIENICKRIRIFALCKNIGKSLSNKYGQKHFDSAKKTTTDAIKCL